MPKILGGAVIDSISGKRIGLFSSFHQKIVYVNDKDKGVYLKLISLNTHNSTSHIHPLSYSRACNESANIDVFKVFEQLKLFDEEFFTIEKISDNQIALRYNNKYVSVRFDEGNRLKATATKIGNWETFYLVRLDEEYDNFALKVVRDNNQKEYFVRAINTADVNSDEGFYLDVVESIGDYEKFRIIWTHIDFKKAISAFANNSNFSTKVKYCSVGTFRQGQYGVSASRENSNAPWGILFHKELITNCGRMLWLYEAFPKPKNPTNGDCDGGFSKDNKGDCYESTWNGVIIESDGYISATCTIPAVAAAAHWDPPIPRAHKNNYIGVVTTTKNSGGNYGRVYMPRLVDLQSASGSDVQMRVRWVIDLGLNVDSERWCIDLGPDAGHFEPQYGILGYHSAGGKCGSSSGSNDWADQRFFGTMKTQLIGPCPESEPTLLSTDSTENWNTQSSFAAAAAAAASESPPVVSASTAVPSSVNSQSFFKQEAASLPSAVLSDNQIAVNVAITRSEEDAKKRAALHRSML